MRGSLKKFVCNLDYTEGLTGADIEHIVNDVIPLILYRKQKKINNKDIVISAIKKLKNESKSGEDQTHFYQ